VRFCIEISRVANEMADPAGSPCLLNRFDVRNHSNNHLQRTKKRMSSIASKVGHAMTISPADQIAGVLREKRRDRVFTEHAARAIHRMQRRAGFFKFTDDVALHPSLLEQNGAPVDGACLAASVAAAIDETARRRCCTNHT
jgi:hypothetical protein